MKKVLVIGSGGREHALGWKLAQSKEVSEVIYAPGNAGTAEGKGRNIQLTGAKKDFDALTTFVQDEGVDMVVVGPEQPLADGIVNFLHAKGYDRVFGPTKEAALLEADKFFSYDIMQQAGIPQAQSIKCYSTEEAIEAIRRHPHEELVIKARGLTAGKGVTVCDTRAQALEEIAQHAEAYGPEVLIAERLYGQEFSIFGISDGNRVSPLELSLQDHKPLLDGDEGPNTGGMGAYGPAPIATAETVRHLTDTVMTPLVQEMKKNGAEYKGFIYGGFMMTKEGPKVIEFNIRFGDPECQPAMTMISDGGLYKPLTLALQGRLEEAAFTFKEGASCCVVLASNGYPGNYSDIKGTTIRGIKEANALDGVKVFHAGTKNKEGNTVVNGGRVLGITAYSAQGIREAQKQAYKGVEAIIQATGDNTFTYRTDIANKALT